MALDDLDRVTHWTVIAAVSTLVIGVLITILLPAINWDGQNQEQQKRKAQTKVIPRHEKRQVSECREEDSGKLEDEPWFPEMVVKGWDEAGELSGCPWSFDGCSSLEDVVRSIWRQPQHKGMQQALSALQSRIKRVRIARVSFCHGKEVYFAALYSLQSGAELFGGEPLDLSSGSDLEFESGPGLRRRHGSGGQSMRTESDMNECILPCLEPFFNIHDGFGVLQSDKHLPLVLTNPGDTIQGSCFYVYPLRGLESLSTKEYLLKFARVDRQCVACADWREDHPNVVFVEQSGELTDDDEPLLDFVADTVCNISGQRVVPNAGGGYGCSRS